MTRRRHTSHKGWRTTDGAQWSAENGRQAESGEPYTVKNDNENNSENENEEVKDTGNDSGHDSGHDSDNGNNIGNNTESDSDSDSDRGVNINIRIVKVLHLQWLLQPFGSNRFRQLELTVPIFRPIGL